MLGLLGGEDVRVHLLGSPRSLVGYVVRDDETGIVLELGDGTTATIPATAIACVRTRAAWATRPA